MVWVQAEGAISIQAFNEGLELLAKPEDPDYEYPPGHFIPFPMAILSVEIPPSISTPSHLTLSAVFP
jgi:hypothetical protein